MNTAAASPTGTAESAVRQLLEEVVDPEIPVLTIDDLGILTDVNVDGGHVEVTITPTYSGCPAMNAIDEEIRRALADAGFSDVTVRHSLTPAWSTDLMSEVGKRKLEEYGIAPPRGIGVAVRCPQCRSENTECISEFGSTACKALYRCLDCAEPFDYFKCL